MSWVAPVVRTLLIGSTALACATPCFGQGSTSATTSPQDSTSDTTSHASPIDSTARPDSTARTDSTALADTIAQASPTDSARRTATSDSVRKVPVAPAVAAVPADSTLLAACAGSSAAAPTLASGLLLLTFVPGTSAEARSAVAKRVQGKLVRPPGSGSLDTYYLQLPSGAAESKLRAIADRVIQFPVVQQVGTEACPPPR
jgi:hypothetical protein